MTLVNQIFLGTFLGLKSCTVCGDWKFPVNFYKHRDGLLPWCKDCDKEKSSQWAGKNRSRRSAQTKACMDKKSDSERKAIFTNASYMKRYGISSTDYFSLSDSQQGVCAVCKGASKSGRALAVDHNHATGQIRGLLCHGCNVALGLAKENPQILRALADYLELHTETTCH